jgi:hypothetical protein
MSQVEVDVPNSEPRNRLTVAFRIILAIPHLIVVYVYQIVAQFVAIAQWFVCVFTGQRNEAMWKFGDEFMGYATRVYAYVELLDDLYPGFTAAKPESVVRYEQGFEPQANRLTVGLRLIWAIPAAIIATVLGIAGSVVILIAWFAILFTGKFPQGMYDFVLKVLRYTLQYLAYTLLLTDVYPRWG